MRVTYKGLAAVSRPLDVTVELFGGPHQAHIFSVQINFGAETAANVRSNHPHFVLRQAHHKRGEQQAFNVRILVGYVQGVVVVCAAVPTNC